MKKLILIDSDGTLRKTDGTISNRTIEIIKRLVEEGSYVVICTGRPRYHTEIIMKDAGASTIIISSNGAEIYDTSIDKVICSSFMDIKECYKLIEYAVMHDLRLVINVGNIEFVTKELKNDNQILLDFNNYKEQLNGHNVYQCMFVDSKIDKIDELKRILENSETIKVKNKINQNKISDSNWFTIGNSDANKGTALISLAKFLNIPIKDTVAIGNDYNDIAMFEVAGFSVCVDNATEDVKECADYITASNDDDGVATVLEKILLDELKKEIY